MIVEVRVKPNSRNPRIELLSGRSLVAYLKSPPVEGKANEELVERLAEHYGVPKSRVRVKSGRASRTKLVEVDV